MRTCTSFTRAIVAAISVGATVAIVACSSDRPAFDDERKEPPRLGEVDAGTQVLDPDAGCLADTLDAVPVPLAMLLVMDRSGSMALPSGNTKWDHARRAMIGFADTKGAAGSKLGLTVFPPDPGPLDRCLASSYAPVVPIATLPGNGPLIKDALASREPASDTPMAAALQGGLDHMNAYLADNSGEEGVIILVTDGDPTGCAGDNVSNVASIAAKAAAGKPRIRTFVVGMEGATFANLDVIAKEGKGAPAAFNASATSADGGVSPQQQLIDALESIRSGAVACQYVMPKPENGKADPSSVEINFRSGTNEPTLNIRRVASAADCGAATGGFYYDDPANPEKITLCPASCEAVQKGTQVAKLDVVLGCIREVH
jgi:von Willebrand factor type A domain